jgi:hypothetical protein
MARLRERGKTIVAIHVRRGDGIRQPFTPFFFNMPPEWWRPWLREIWKRFPDPVIYVASNDPQPIVDGLAEFKPLTARELGVKFPPDIRGCGYFVDHYVLSHADVLGISNSTFSVTAAMLNRDAKLVVRGTLATPTRLETIDPWDIMPLLHFCQLPTRRTIREIVSLTRETQGRLGVVKALVRDVPKQLVVTWAIFGWIAFDADGLLGVVRMVLRIAFSWRDVWKLKMVPALKGGA